MATFFFRAVASDGKIRSGSLAGDSEKTVAVDLRKQGLIPVYVGAAPKNVNFELKLPAFGLRKRHNVLFFTQELSTLLNASVPLDRALSITAELTDKPSFRVLVLDVLRVLKRQNPGRQPGDSSGPFFRSLHQHGARRGSRRLAGGGLRPALGVRAHARRTAQLHRLFDDLPGPAGHVGLCSILILLNFVVPRFATIFEGGTMKVPVPAQIMIEATHIVRIAGGKAASTLAALFVTWRRC